MLTKKQRDVLQFIEDFQHENSGATPSMTTIRDEMKFASKGGVHRLVCALEERGFVERDETWAPGSRVARPLRVVRSLQAIPIFRSGDHKIMGYVS